MNEKYKTIRCLPQPTCYGLMFFCHDCERWHLHGRYEGDKSSHCQKMKSYTIEIHSVKDLMDIRRGIDSYLAMTSEQRKDIYNIVVKTCAQCDSPLPSSRFKYCSELCKKENRKESKDRRRRMRISRGWKQLRREGDSENE